MVKSGTLWDFVETRGKYYKVHKVKPLFYVCPTGGGLPWVPLRVYVVFLGLSGKSWEFFRSSGIPLECLGCFR